MAQIGKTCVFLKSEAYQHLEVVKKQKLQVFAKVAVCGALVSISRMRTAAFLRYRSVEVVQSFLASLHRQRVCREEYHPRRDAITANVTALLALQQRAASPTPQLRNCGVDALRDPVLGPGRLQGTVTSPTHPVYQTPERERTGRISDGGYGSNSRSDGIPQECSPSPNNERVRSRHYGFDDTAIAVYSDPLREKERLGKERIQPDRNCSLEIVRRLRPLQTSRDGSLLCTTKFRKMEDPLNPYSDSWVIPLNGVLMFPDGFSCNIQDVASGKLLNGGDGRDSKSGERDGSHASYYIMDFEK
ncbi:hypothetical protein LSM04_009427 [Trypanosoma melophagium]|uniref:uncharacterized protein n=1 Tax=Trypanosoma melophagium TaxID=715481 RepID=UPI00351A7B4F|nr:hypothetical protein LSM04_009427 [Trypanosoma melophagium]